MSPHAVSPDDTQTSYEYRASEPTGVKQASQTSLLERYSDDKLHDLVCIGFGPASLAVAVALHDALEAKTPAVAKDAPKVRFLERQDRFAWHAGMLLPGTKMQITFIKDLATLRNPRSQFTFLNYLHNKDRLVQFTNLGTFLPQRIEYEDYMRWCAEHFEDVVDYGQSVESVEVDSRNSKTGAVESFSVRSLDKTTGRPSLTKARHVVIAVGGRPNMPKCLPASHPRVIHSSQYATTISSIFPPGSEPKSIAVIGGGQSAGKTQCVKGYFETASTTVVAHDA
jgi:L-ornithine N5-oxygenase